MLDELLDELDFEALLLDLEEEEALELDSLEDEDSLLEDDSSMDVFWLV